MTLDIERHVAPSGGWELDVRRHSQAERLDPELRPVLLIPGYCMNTTPLGFHPSGPSMIELLAARGFEVWTANLRHQGESRNVGTSTRAGFADLALGDLPAALELVRARTRSRHDRVDLVGCSLGGTYIFTYLAHHPDSASVGSFVAIGAPLRWGRAHPLLRVLFSSPGLAGRLRISGTRRVAGVVLPLLARRLPVALSLYMNASIVDLSRADELVQTVEDPIPELNAEIATWVSSGALTVRGVDVAEGLARTSRPFLAVVANRDGIVPPESARSALDVVPHGELLEVGDERTWFAHADLFISRHAQEQVFEPLAAWLRRQTAAGS